jgi:hypothetical protein
MTPIRDTHSDFDTINMPIYVCVYDAVVPNSMSQSLFAVDFSGAVTPNFGARIPHSERLMQTTQL